MDVCSEYYLGFVLRSCLRHFKLFQGKGSKSHLRRKSVTLSDYIKLSTLRCLCMHPESPSPEDCSCGWICRRRYVSFRLIGMACFEVPFSFDA